MQTYITTALKQKAQYKRAIISLLVMLLFLTSACAKTSSQQKPQIKIQGSTEISVGHSKKLQ